MIDIQVRDKLSYTECKAQPWDRWVSGWVGGGLVSLRRGADLALSVLSPSPCAVARIRGRLTRSAAETRNYTSTRSI